MSANRLDSSLAVHKSASCQRNTEDREKKEREREEELPELSTPHST
jgi:hypothetical protein